MTSLLRRTTFALILPSVLAVGTVGLTGCKTDAPGIKSNYVQQWTIVDGDVEAASETAESVLEDYDFKEVDATMDKVSGVVTAMMADGSKVTVDVRKATQETSEVTVRIGTAGDNALGKEIATKIRKKLAE